MIRNIITLNDVKSFEPMLCDYDEQNGAFSTLIERSFMTMLHDLRNLGFDLRQLNIPLSLHSGSITANSTTEEVSDTINRSILTIDYTITTETDFHLQGSNDGINWTDVYKNLIQIGDGTINIPLTSFYKQYRIKFGNGEGTMDVFLSEGIYYFMTLYKAMELIFNSLRHIPNNTIFDEKALEYGEKYNYLLNNGRFYYDGDNDGAVTTSDANNGLRTINIVL